MSNSIRRIIDAVAVACDTERDALDEAGLEDKVERDVALFVGGLSALEFRYRDALTEAGQ